MLIDTDNKIVLFPANTALDLDTLYTLLELLDPICTCEHDHDDIPDGFVRESDIVRIRMVASQTSTDVYAVVEFNDASYACSCPDWTYRRSQSPYNDPCKHILRVHLSKKP